MIKALIPILCISSTIFAQDNYRLHFGLSLHSTFFGGTRSFEDVSRGGSNTISYYEKEVYSIDYKNMEFSSGFSLNFAFNWIWKEKYVLRQSTSFFADIYQEVITYTLTDLEVGDTNLYPTLAYDHDFNLGDENLAQMNGVGFGFVNDLVLLRCLGLEWKIGGGIAFNINRRNDHSYLASQERYGPNDTRLTFGQYTTNQIGLVFRVEKSFDRWNFFLNLNQALFTAKKNANKGGDYFPDGDRIHPISANLDYRFPLLINLGATMQLAKIKK